LIQKAQSELIEADGAPETQRQPEYVAQQRTRAIDD
jgi:hypothetical protein